MASVDMNHPAPETVPVRDAATVVVVRQAASGIEVCMLQRNLASDFVGGAYVFPGGAVDPGDNDEIYRDLLVEPADGERSGRAENRAEVEDLAFRVAAARESFEEAGILLACDNSGSQLDLTDRDVIERFRRHRTDVDTGRRALHEICVEEELRLDLWGMRYLSRWVTPFGAPRRYDTRFYVTDAPAAQDAVHDDREVIDTVWISPERALEDARSGRRTMIFPTIRTMVAISVFDDVGELLDHVSKIDKVEAVEPSMVEIDGQLRLELPGDPEGNGGKYDALTGEPLSAS